MIKRINKITSVLVATSAIFSVIGPIQVNAETYPRISSEEGTIYEALAYKDGKFYINGEINEGRDEGAYYIDGDKYIKINNSDTETELYKTYSDKYAEMDEGDYFLDMSSGEISEGTLIEDDSVYAAIALRKKIRKNTENRYSDHNERKKDLVEIPRIKFGESWYATNYDGHTIYTDSNGNYVDADYDLGKIKIVTASGNTVKLKNTDDREEKTKASVSNSKVLGQDADYIYRTVKITIESSEVISKIDGIDVNNGNAFDTSQNEGKTVSFLAIQKISKEQAEEKIDGANYAKTTVTYVLSSTDGISVSLLDGAKISISNGYIVEYIMESGLVTIQTVSLYESKEIQNYVCTNNIDPEEIENMDIDSSGNLWRIKDRIVYKFDNYSKWDKIYKVDKGMDRLSVYDENNMIIWDEDGEGYSKKVVDVKEDDDTKKEEKMKEVITEETKLEEVLASKFGWIINTDGSKSYNNSVGISTVGWLYDENNWYYFDNSGIMKKGWIKENNKWYYLNESGAMKTGWVNDSGRWYYLNSSGEMLHDTIIDGYKLGSNGDLI